MTEEHSPELLAQARIVVKHGYMRLPAPAALEHKYQQDNMERRETHLLITVSAGLLSCASYIFADYVVLEHHFSEAFTLRALLFLPIALTLVGCFYVARETLRRFQEFALCFGITCLSFLVLYIEYLATKEGVTYYTSSTLLVIAYACIIIHMNFYYAALMCAITLAASLYCFQSWMLLPSDQVMVLAIDHIDIIALSLVANYVMHLQSRKNFAHLILLDNERRMLTVAKSQLLELTELDPLTEIGNRRYLEDRARFLLDNPQHNINRISVLFVDIDHFKAFNDHYGHKEGDSALKLVAQAIRNSLRDNDICARYGGEEFVVLLPNATAQLADKVALRIQEKLNRLEIRHEYSNKGYVSVSIGLYLYENDESNVITLDELLEPADKALYTAKEQGRDRIHRVA